MNLDTKNQFNLLYSPVTLLVKGAFLFSGFFYYKNLICKTGWGKMNKTLSLPNSIV